MLITMNASSFTLVITLGVSAADSRRMSAIDDHSE